MDIAEEIELEGERLFKPRPGGLVDRYEQDKARRHEAETERENSDARIEENSYKAVKVAIESPELFSAANIPLLVNASSMILPLSPYRYRAMIMMETQNAVGVRIGKDQAQVAGGGGFLLPFSPVGFPLSGSVMELFTRGQVWAFNGSVVPIVISVISELRAPEK